MTSSKLLIFVWYIIIIIKITNPQAKMLASLDRSCFVVVFQWYGCPGIVQSLFEHVDIAHINDVWWQVVPKFDGSSVESISLESSDPIRCFRGDGGESYVSDSVGCVVEMKVIEFPYRTNWNAYTSLSYHHAFFYREVLVTSVAGVGPYIPGFQGHQLA